MAARRYHTRQAKTLRCYTIAEAAELYGVHRQTIRHWIAGGLPTIDNRRPFLLHGEQLNLFHKKRRRASRASCGPGEVFCFGCRAPRRPAAGMADFAQVTDKLGTVSAICPVCERMMSQHVNAERLAGFTAELTVTARPAPKPIGEGC